MQFLNLHTKTMIEVPDDKVGSKTKIGLDGRTRYFLTADHDGTHYVKMCNREIYERIAGQPVKFVPRPDDPRDGGAVLNANAESEMFGQPVAIPEPVEFDALRRSDGLPSITAAMMGAPKQFNRQSPEVERSQREFWRWVILLVLAILVAAVMCFVLPGLPNGGIR